MVIRFTDYVTSTPCSILLVSPRIEDHNSLESLFHGSLWKMQGAYTAIEGLKIIRRNRSEIPVVICEHSLPDGDWRILLAELRATEVQSSRIVCSRLADERLWVEVLKLGAFDLLLSGPFVPKEVIRATRNAWIASNSALRPKVIPREVYGPIRCRPNALASGNAV